MIKSLTDTLSLSNGVGIPGIGFGTYKAASGIEAENAVIKALEAGYRHIDTASVYKNEKSVGKGIRQSGIPRDDIFVTSKVWNSDQGYESTLAAFDCSLDELQMDYLDLYLIHWPRIAGHEEQWVELNRQTWAAMQELYSQKKIRAIGVSNFLPHHIDSLLSTATVKPMVNQIELHPGLPQEQTVKYCSEHEIIVEAWGPFSQGRIFKTEVIDEIANKYGKTVAQICLRWHIQRDILPLPKSVTPERIVENTEIFDFELSPEDMNRIGAMKDIPGSGMDPDKEAH